MSTTIVDRIKGFFARDKDAYWWSHFTDEEKQLRRMDVWELAKVINEARTRNLAGESEKLIVAEHMLAERLARIQARPGYVAAVAGLFGVVVGVFLTSALQPSEATPKTVCECQVAPLPQQVAAPVPNAPPTAALPEVPKGGGASPNRARHAKPQEKSRDEP
jgi:hypothetical protein